MKKNALCIQFRSRAENFVALCFLLILLIPGTPLLWHNGIRQFAAEPAPQSVSDSKVASLMARYGQFKTWFESSFSYRMTLVHCHARFKRDLLGVSPSNRVAFGDSDWLFYTAENEVPCSRHALYSKDQLARVTSTIKSNSEYCRQRGIHYIFFVAPDKHTIYPEYLPDNLRPRLSLSRLDQLMDSLKSNTDVDVIDLRPTLLEGKSHKRLYYLTDTHWNPTGAFIAYQSIISYMNQWYPKLSPVPISKCKSKHVTFSGDLASFTGLQLKEQVQTIQEIHESTRFKAANGADVKSPRTRIDELRSINSDAHIGKLVMFRDSFATETIPHLAGHFRQGVYIWSRYDANVIDKEKPDVVIEEVVERDLML